MFPNLSIKINDECIKCIQTPKCIYETRNNFINECLPLYDLKMSKINILDFDKKSYIYFDSSNDIANTYFINNKLQLEKYDDSSIPKYENFNYIVEFQNKLNYEINIDHINIPIYYLFINDNNQLFDIFILNFTLKFIDNEKDKMVIKDMKNILKSLFQYNSKKKFVKMSYKFNIFNIAFLCNKIIEIFKLFFIDYTKDELIDKLNDIFYEYDIQNVYSLIDEYKFNIMNIKNNKYDLMTLEIKSIIDELTIDNIYKKFINSIFNNNPIENIEKIKSIFVVLIENINNQDLKEKNLKDLLEEIKSTTVKDKNVQKNIKSLSLDILNKNIMKLITDLLFMNSIINVEYGTLQKTKNQIIDELAIVIIYIKIILDEIDLLIPDFKKIFLMTILNYRLKENYINNSWCFNAKKICNDIIKISNENSSLDNNILFSMYIPYKPIIYEYSYIEYNNITYGNCMENVILQFLKVLFWDPNLDNNKGNYNKSFMDNIVKNNIVEEIKEIFNNINNEKTRKFDNDWVKFIMKLPIEYPDINIPKYDFINDNYELDATLINFISVLRYIVKINYTNNDDYLNQIIRITDIYENDNDEYNISIEEMSNEQLNPSGLVLEPKSKIMVEQIININSYRKLKIKLINKEHAFFMNAKTNINILNKIKIIDDSISNFLNNKENIYMSYENIDFYICLINIDKKSDLFDMYINSLSKDIIANAYYLLFDDDIILNDKILFNIANNNNIFKYYCYFYEDIILWYYIIVKLKSNIDFWNIIAINYDFNDWNILDNEKNTIWYYAIKFLDKNNNFWKLIANRDNFITLINTWKNTNGNNKMIWEDALFYLGKIDDFWNIIAFKYDFNNWNDMNGNNLWLHTVISLGNNSKFWEILADTKKINDIENYNLWLVFIQNILIKSFWTKFALNFDKWDKLEILDVKFWANIKNNEIFDDFWKHIRLNRNFINYYETLDKSTLKLSILQIINDKLISINILAMHNKYNKYKTKYLNLKYIESY